MADFDPDSMLPSVFALIASQGKDIGNAVLTSKSLPSVFPDVDAEKSKQSCIFIALAVLTEMRDKSAITLTLEGIADQTRSYGDWECQVETQILDISEPMISKSVQSMSQAKKRQFLSRMIDDMPPCVSIDTINTPFKGDNENLVLMRTALIRTCVLLASLNPFAGQAYEGVFFALDHVEKRARAIRVVLTRSTNAVPQKLETPSHQQQV